MPLLTPSQFHWYILLLLLYISSVETSERRENRRSAYLLKSPSSFSEFISLFFYSDCCARFNQFPGQHLRNTQMISRNPNLSRVRMVLRTPALKGKTNKSIAKRFKVTASGKWLRRSAGQQHRLSQKSPRRKRRLRQVQVLPSTWRKIYMGVVMPSKRGTRKAFHPKILKFPEGRGMLADDIIAGRRECLPIIRKIMNEQNAENFASDC